MKKLILALILLLAGASNAFGQSTTVSSTVTDSGGVVWAGGSYEFNFVGPVQVTWPGGAVTRIVKGSLSSSGAFSQSLPDNNTISPSPTFWSLKVCPLVGINQACYTQTNLTITGATQSLTVTPPALSISAGSLPVAAYADAEITAPVALGFIYYQATTATTGTYRQCQGLTNSACTTWANVAASGGGGVTPCGGAANTQVAFFTAATTLCGSANFTFATATTSLTVTSATNNGVETINSGTGGDSHIGAGNNFLDITGLTNGNTSQLASLETGGIVLIGADQGVALQSNHANMTLSTLSTEPIDIFSVDHATAIANITSPLVYLQDQVWDGAASAGDGYSIQSVPASGSLAASILSITRASVACAGCAGASELDLGRIGRGGIFGLIGGTDGVAATFTAPATAGTPSNPVAMSNALTFPSIAAFAPTTAGVFGYDSTNNRFVGGNGTNTSFIPWFTAAPTNGQCATWSGTVGLLTSTACGGAVAFNAITSGTNTTAAMVVGAGASLNFTSTGTINASSLGGATFAAPGTIGGTTPGIGDFSALNCGVLNTTACVLTGFGSTSGFATFTWPAVAGTSTNPVVSSNYFSMPALVLPGSGSGSATIIPQAAAGTPTLTLGTSSGTPAVTASSPLAITTATGNITCATCVTSAAALTNNAVMAGSGSQGSQTPSTTLLVNTVLADIGNNANTGQGITFGTNLSVGTGTAGKIQLGVGAAAGIEMSIFSLIGTNDTIMQVVAPTSSAYSIIEGIGTSGVNSAGLAIETLSTTPNILMRPNRTTTVTFTAAGIALGTSAHLSIGVAAPTISSGFGTSPSVTASNGTAAFRINVGTSNTGNGVIALPTATTGWNCYATDITTTSASVSQTKTTGSTTTTATLQNYTDLSATGAWTDSDILAVSCYAF